MYFLIVYLFEDSYLTDVLLAMTQVLENRLIVQDGATNEEHLSRALPVFSDFGSALSGRQKFCKIINTITSRKDAVPALLKALNEANIDFKKLNLGDICMIKTEDSFIGEETE